MHSFDLVPNKSPDNTTMQQDSTLGTQTFTANTFRSIFKIDNVSHSQLKYSKQTEQEVSMWMIFITTHLFIRYLLAEWKCSLLDFAHNLGQVPKHKNDIFGTTG